MGRSVPWNSTKSSSFITEPKFLNHRPRLHKCQSVVLTNGDQVQVHDFALIHPDFLDDGSGEFAVRKILEFLHCISELQTVVWALVELHILGEFTFPSQYPLLRKSDRGVELLDAEVSTDFAYGVTTLICPSISLPLSTHSTTVLTMTAPSSQGKYYGRNVTRTLRCMSEHFAIRMNRIIIS